MSTFDPGRKYFPSEVNDLDPELYTRLSQFHRWVPGDWFPNRRAVQTAASELFEVGSADGSLLNAASE